MNLGNKIFSGVIWSSVNTLSNQIVSFILGIVLARLLTPVEYGTIGLLMVFIAISKVFIDSGFTQALIQRKNRTQEDISTVFFFNIIISVICYLLLWIAAPYIADFYNIQTLSYLLRILALSLVINGLFAVPATLLTINMDFKSFTKVNLSATLISGITAISLAYKGFGVWALVIQTILNSTITLVLIWLLVKWRPSRIFNKKSFKELFSFGSNLLVSSLINTVVNDLAELSIGKVLSTKELGLYTRGTQFSNFVSSTISSILDSVLLPGLVSLQDNLQLLTKSIKQILKITALIIIPLFLGLTILAKPIILVLLTDKWIEVVPIMQIFCISRLITLLSGININLLYIIGRTDLTLKQQYIKIPVRIFFLVISIKHGIIYIALGELVSTIIHFFINTYYPGKFMNYNSIKQLRDILPFLFSGIIMLVIIYLSINQVESNVLKLFIGILVGITTYLMVLWFITKDELLFVWNKLKEFRKN